MNSLERLQLKSKMGRVAVFSILLLFSCVVAGCSDKGDPIPEGPPAGPRVSYIFPEALWDFDTITEVAVIDETDWGSTESLPEGAMWKWDGTEQRIALWSDTAYRRASSGNLDFPVYLRVTGISNGRYHTMATRLTRPEDSVAASDVTSLVVAQAILKDTSFDQAKTLVTRLFGVEQDPFDVIPTEEREGALSKALEGLAENFTGQSQEEAVNSFENIDFEQIVILPSSGLPSVLACFTPSVDYGFCPLEIEFTSLSLGKIEKYEWDFGDGATAGGSSSDHVYTSWGAYKATLTVTGCDGAVYDTSEEIDVFSTALAPPEAGFTPSTIYGNCPLTVTFTNSSQGEAYKYEWDFGDGTTSREESPEHTYTTAGRHLVTLTATGGGGRDTVSKTINPGRFTAVVATAASDFSSGGHSVIPVDTLVPRNDLLPTTSDITMVAHGRYFYRIERYMHDNVTKFSIDNPERVIWQYSALRPEDGASSNPHDLVFVNSQKAYLIRYGSDKAWIVNPSATTSGAFKIGELDLSAYADQDGLPEMTRAVIVGNRLFIALERLDRTYYTGIWQPNEAYVAVFDTITDQEIDTKMGGVNDVCGKPLKGVPLTVENPINMQYLAENNTIYIQAVGTYPMTGFLGKDTGGIESLDPQTYERKLVLDDGEGPGNLPYGNISGMAIVSPEKGYFVGYKKWMDNSFYAFRIDESGHADMTSIREVAGLTGRNIAVLEAGASLDNRGRLWVCNRTDNGIAIIDPADDTQQEFVHTGLPPLKVVFCIE